MPYFLQRFSTALSETPNSAATCVVGISQTSFSSSSGVISNRRLAREAHVAEQYFRWASDAGASNGFPQRWQESVTGAAGSPRVRARSSAAVTSARFSGRTSVLSPFRNNTFSSAFIHRPSRTDITCRWSAT
jgi:hypothetical protein